jgi:hypothetical protein
MNHRFVAVLASITFLACSLTADRIVLASEQGRVPIVVELFTSEGCSSCPPADAFLQKLDDQPVAGAELVVLSEHVDYWNHDGWKDPYSSAELTERQRNYGDRFHLDSVYTPQMVLDGGKEVLGSNVPAVQKAIAEALLQPKVALQISQVSVEHDRLRAHVETGTLDASRGVRSADVYVAVALNHAESQVLRGENANRRLTHAAVVRKLVKVGKIKSGEQFVRDVELKIDAGSDPHNLRLSAFLQDPGSGKIVGAAMQYVDSSSQH